MASQMAPVSRCARELGADLGADVGLQKFAGHPGHALTQHIGVLVGEQLVGRSAAIILALSVDGRESPCAAVSS